MPLDRPPLAREQFPVSEQWLYLNHAGIAPLPRAGYEAARLADEEWMRHGGEAELHWFDRSEIVRASAAELMGASAAEVAFVKNTTEGIAFVAGGLDWAPGDRVLVPDAEYPSTLFPFLALEDRGVEVVKIAPQSREGALPLDAFEAELQRGGVHLVSISWVQFGTGWRTDLAALTRLAHEHGALVCIDAIQGLGLVPCDLPAWGVDVAIAGGHKWLLGPQGVGVLFVAQRHLDADTFRVTEPGWNSMTTRDDSDVLDLSFDPTARRYEGGTHNLTSIAALGAGIDLLRAAGIDAVWRHVTEWCATATDRLADVGASVVTTTDPDHRAGILTVAVEGMTGAALTDALVASGVACRPRAGGARLSPHAWNDHDDLDRLIQLVAAQVG